MNGTSPKLVMWNVPSHHPRHLSCFVPFLPFPSLVLFGGQSWQAKAVGSILIILRRRHPLKVSWLVVMLRGVITLLLLCIGSQRLIAYKPCIVHRRASIRLASNDASTESIDASTESIWASRRKMIRFVLKPSAKAKLDQKDVVEEEPPETEENKLSGLFLPALVAIIGAVALRLGGRAGFISFLGLDFVNDSGLKEQISQLLAFFQASEPTVQFIEFFGAWLVAKVFCIDVLTIVLAISSGLLFSYTDNPLCKY